MCFSGFLLPSFEANHILADEDEWRIGRVLVPLSSSGWPLLRHWLRHSVRWNCLITIIVRYVSLLLFVSDARELLYLNDIGILLFCKLCRWCPTMILHTKDMNEALVWQWSLFKRTIAHEYIFTLLEVKHSLIDLDFVDDFNCHPWRSDQLFIQMKGNIEYFASRESEQFSWASRLNCFGGNAGWLASYNMLLGYVSRL